MDKSSPNYLLVKCPKCKVPRQQVCKKIGDGEHDMPDGVTYGAPIKDMPRQHYLRKEAYYKMAGMGK